MTKDLNRLAEYFSVPLQLPADPFEVMVQKGTSRISSIMSIDWTIRPKLFDPIRPYLTPKDILTEAMTLDFDRSSTFKEKHKCLLLFVVFLRGGNMQLKQIIFRYGKLNSIILNSQKFG